MNAPLCWTDTVLEVDRVHRWNIYHRLLQLEIICSCTTDRPLQAEIIKVADAIQVWCVIKQIIASRNDCVQWLEKCLYKESSNGQEL